MCLRKVIKTSQHTVLTLCLLGYFACFCRLLIFIKINVLKNIFQEYCQSVNHSDPDFVGPDLGTNCLHMLSADDTMDAISANSDMQITGKHLM